MNSEKIMKVNQLINLQDFVSKRVNLKSYVFINSEPVKFYDRRNLRELWFSGNTMHE